MRSISKWAPLLVASVFLTPGAAQAATVPAAAQTLEVSRTPAQLGLPSSAPLPRIARAAAKRYAGRLGVGDVSQLALHGSYGEAAGAGGKPIRSFEFRQRLGGRDVQWSQVVVHLQGRKVVLVTGAGQRTRGALRDGRLAPAKAKAIAERAAPGSGTASVSKPIIWVGMPGSKAKRPRAAVLVQVDPNSDDPIADEPVEITPGITSHFEGADPVCVVVDAASGEVISTWEGTAEGETEPPTVDDTPDALVGKAPVARAAQTGDFRLVRVRDAAGRTQADTQADEADLASRSVRWPESTAPTPSTFDFNRVIFTGANFASGTGLGALFANAQLLQGILCQRVARRCLNRMDLLSPGSAWDIFGNVNLGSETLLGKHESGSRRRIHIAGRAVRSFDTLGHEMGHEWAQQTVGTVPSKGEGGAVQEAIADITAYLAGGNRTTFNNVDGVTPLNFMQPTFHMNNYRRDCSQIYFNSTILLRGFVESQDDQIGDKFGKVQTAFRTAMENRMFSPASGMVAFYKAIRAAMNMTAGNGAGNSVFTGFRNVGINENTVVPSCT